LKETLKAMKLRLNCFGKSNIGLSFDINIDEEKSKMNSVWLLVDIAIQIKFIILK
jgi:hypothetical protein